MPRVIVIDEDEPLRALLGEWLLAAGWQVREATLRDIVDGRNAEAVELVVMDLPRLRLQGAALVLRVRTVQPRAALLGLSTQVCERLPPGSLLVRELGLNGLLAKPCSRSELLAAAAEALAAGWAG